ncbi:MAG: hypothetical protein R6W66_04785, partial [Pelovirga sp.]
MKSSVWMFFVMVCMFFIAPVLIVLTVLGSASVSLSTIMMYWFPLAFVAVIVTSLIFHRQSQQRKTV